jgi:hypothetical protein
MRQEIWYICLNRINLVSSCKFTNQHNNMKITNLKNKYKTNQCSIMETQHSVFHYTEEDIPALETCPCIVA